MADAVEIHTAGAGGGHASTHRSSPGGEDTEKKRNKKHRKASTHPAHGNDKDEKDAAKSSAVEGKKSKHKRKAKHEAEGAAASRSESPGPPSAPSGAAVPPAASAASAPTAEMIESSPVKGPVMLGDSNRPEILPVIEDTKGKSLFVTILGSVVAFVLMVVVVVVMLVAYYKQRTASVTAGPLSNNDTMWLSTTAGSLEMNMTQGNFAEGPPLTETT